MAETNTSPANQSGVDTDASPVFQSGRPPTHLDNSEEDSTNAPESSQVKFNNVLKCNVLGYTGPKNEDNEYYQLYHIDDSDKIQGASTPFQFLEQPAEDCVKLQDDRIDINMIREKHAMEPIFHKKCKKLKHEVKGMLHLLQMGDDDDDDEKGSISSSTDSSTSLKEVDKDLSNLTITESGEGNSPDRQVASEQTSEGAQATTAAGSDLSTQAIQAPTNQGTNEDLEEMDEDMCSLSKALEEREKEMDRLKRVIKEDKKKQESLMMDLDRQTEEMKEQKKKLQLQSDKKETNLLKKIKNLDDGIQHLEETKRERERRSQAKIRSQKLKIDRLVKKNGEICDKFTKMKHMFECLRTYYVRWADSVDRLNGRPPRCMAVTIEGMLCKRYAKVITANLGFCRQHARMCNFVA